MPTAARRRRDAAPAQLAGPTSIDQVKSRNGLLASILGSAHPLALDDIVLIVAFGTEFNRKTAEKTTNRQLIEAAFERVYGAAYRLRCTVEPLTRRPEPAR